MNKTYHYLSWFCISIMVIILVLTGYILSVHGIWGIEYYKLKFNTHANRQLRKLKVWFYKQNNQGDQGNKQELKEYRVLHDHLRYLKDERGQVRINQEVRKVFFAQPGKPIKKVLEIEADTIMDVGYGIVPDLSDEKYLGNVRFSILLEHQNKKVALISQEVEGRKVRSLKFRIAFGRTMNQKFQAEVNGHWQDMTWHDTTIDLSQYAGKKVTLYFITDNLDSASPWAVWSYPQIYQKNKSDKDFNVLIVSLDTLRADHLNCYNYKKRTTSPNMNKLAEEGLLFKQFYSNSPGTLSSQISILTGLYPSYHGITYRNFWETMTDLSPDRIISRRLIPQETLTTILAKNGYYNIAYTGAGYFLACLDYSTGFHLYNNTIDHTNGSVKNVFPKAFKWLEQNSKRKFFLFLHTYEIHSPFTETYFVEKEGIPPHPKFEKDRALYDSCILLTDKYIGKLVSVLKKTNLWGKTILIITSDHGEELGSRYGVEKHGHTLFNEIIHVPCIIILPDGFPQHKVIDTVASSVDLVPTILDILGINSKITYSGKSLLPIIHGTQDKNRFAYSEDINYGPDLKSLVRKHIGKKREELYKFLYINPSERKHRNRYRFENIEKLQTPPAKRLFNLDRDPGETFNQTGIGYVDSTLYQTMINDLIMNMPPSAPEPRKGIKASQNALKSLKALGYIQ